MSESRFAGPLELPCYVAIFVSQRRAGGEGYDQIAMRMFELASRQPGFLGVETARGADGFGITLSYWRDEASIAEWRADAEHREAQRRGRTDFYERFELRVARVERQRGFGPRQGDSAT